MLYAKLVAMPSLIFTLTAGQIRQVVEDSGSPDYDRRPIALDVVGVLPSEYGPVSIDSSGTLDHYIRRCIGTVRELVDHQARGGVVLLEYPDGSLREVEIDPTNEGVRLPRTQINRKRPRRFVRRRPRSEERDIT